MRCFLPALVCLVFWSTGAEASMAMKWCGEPVPAHGDEEHEGRVASLSGIVISKPERGPPGWGETPKVDTHWTAWFIKLDYATPMIVPDFHSGALRTKIEYEIQVRGKFEFDGTYKRLKGRHVVVTGPLGQGAEPSNLGDAQIETTKVEIVSPVACDGKIKP